MQKSVSGKSFESKNLKNYIPAKVQGTSFNHNIKKPKISILLR